MLVDTLVEMFWVRISSGVVEEVVFDDDAADVAFDNAIGKGRLIAQDGGMIVKSVSHGNIKIPEEYTILSGLMRIFTALHLEEEYLKSTNR